MGILQRLNRLEEVTGQFPNDKKINLGAVHLTHGYEECNCNILTNYKDFDTGSAGLISSII